VLCALVAGASSAAAAPADDLRAVLRDWQPDHDIANCRFTRAQLVNARDVAAALTDFDSYAPGFRDEVLREIARHDAGDCRGVVPSPSGARNRSRLRSIRIVAIKPKGGTLENVTIRNAGPGAVSLKGATLRDRRGNRLRLPAVGKLKGKRSLLVVSGCARGRRKPARLGSRLFACRSRGIWDDRGDVVKVVDSRGTVVAQRGYGSLRSVPRF
jgi:hypothetical protein